MSPSAVADPPYRVEHQGNEIVVRVNSELMSREELMDILDFIYLESIRQKASLSEDEIEELSRMVKRSAWKKLRPMVEEKLRGR
ncbi:MAG TPA: hypothetical protein VJT67_13995 [Longimicrobiaceae bacterium]|nr:hypothetical protein [Longimicrobiaceae bacterium]